MIKKLLMTTVGLLGLRLDEGDYLLRLSLWAISPIVLNLFLFTHLNNKSLIIAYVLCAWTFYYLGNSLILSSEKIRSYLSLKSYSVLLGIAFYNQGVALSFLCSGFSNSFSKNIPVWLTLTTGALLFIFGATVKFWATWLTGLDTYYYSDMFLNKAIQHDDTFVITGPYKWFTNPMYGVGNLQTYGLAIFMRSYEGLLCALIFHISIYVFYYVLEKPFFVKTYLSPVTPLIK